MEEAAAKDLLEFFFIQFWAMLSIENRHRTIARSRDRILFEEADSRMGGLQFEGDNKVQNWEA